jgi:hypothetical protein
MRAERAVSPWLVNTAVFISSDTKQVLFTTNVAVDGVDHVVEVRDVRRTGSRSCCFAR